MGLITTPAVGEPRLEVRETGEPEIVVGVTVGQRSIGKHQEEAR